MVDEGSYGSSLSRRDRILNTITQTPNITSLSELLKEVTLEESDKVRQLVNKWFPDVRVHRGNPITLERRVPTFQQLSDTIPIVEQINQVLCAHPEGLCVSDIPDHIMLPVTNLTKALTSMGFKYQLVDGIPVFHPMVSLSQSQANVLQQVVDNGGSLPISKVTILTIFLFQT